ncbi:MAG: sialidase family protein [Gemmatimonadota bacterium]|nr:sialidase family protein [Gemmatimonadota bacterium]
MRTSPLRAVITLAAGIVAIGLIPVNGPLTGPLALTTPLAAQSPEVVVGPNLRVGPGQFNEPWIAASQDNPDFLIAVTQTGGLSFPDPAIAMTLATRNNAAFLSRNGGVAWEPIMLPGDEVGAFDPMVVPGPDGRMWILYCYVGANTMGDMFGESVRSDGTIMVWSTDDEGATWTGPARLRSPVPPDHARIAADWSDGPNRGRLYVVWNDVRDSFIRDDFQLFLHTLDDGGNTVSEPKLLATIPGGKLVATEPVVLSDGTLLVTFYQYFFPLSDEKNARMPFFTMRSEDGGETFTEPEVAFRVGTHSWPYAQTEMTSAFTLPIVAWDRTDGPHADNIYVVWDGVTGGDAATAATSDVWFRRSTDGGRSWSDQMRLNDNEPPAPGDPLDDRMLPVVEVNRDGVVGVAWYDRRRDDTRRCWELFFTSSSDGGETFGANVPVASAPSCPPPAHAPVARVHNVAADPDVKDLTEEEIAKMDLVQRMTVVMAEQSRNARAEYFGDLDHARLEVSFDNARGNQPGHYLGLAGDANGAFHPLWISRRNGTDELFTTTVEVTASAPAAPTGEETDVTGALLVVAGPVVYDAASGTATVEVQLRNVSDGVVHGPVRLRAEGGEAREGSEWSFEGRMGSHDRLPPGGLSEPVKVKLTTGPGMDARLDFRVYGKVGG